MRFNRLFTVVITMAVTGFLSACGNKVKPSSDTRRSGTEMFADDIPVAHTPPGGYGNVLPPPVLAQCKEPLVDGAPDLRGLWKAVRVNRGAEVVPTTDRLYHYVERIEQCGNRIVDMGGGTIADGRADGTAEHGIHDVFVFDYRTPLHVIVTFEGGTTYVLQPMLVSVIARRFPAINIPWSWLPVVVPWLNVTRRLDSEGNLVWTRPDQDFVMTLERIGGPNEPYTRLDLPMSTIGGSGLTAGR